MHPRSFTSRLTVRGLVVLLASTSILLGSPATPPQAPTGTPLDQLPPHTEVLLDWGHRPEWSPDGKYLYFVEKPFGDIYRIDLATRRTEPVTTHYSHGGYLRVLCLANGDLLLGGGPNFDPKDPMRHRHNLQMSVLRPDGQSEPHLIGHCDEGPAVSRRTLQIAWTTPGQTQIMTGEIQYEGAKAVLVNQRVLVSRAQDSLERLETQDFLPPNDEQLIYTAYHGDAPDYRIFIRGDVEGLNLKTGQVTDYTKRSDVYNEAEGIHPSGKYLILESDRHAGRRMWIVDLYRLWLDGTGRTERLTRFTDWPGFIADNPVVSPDGRWMAFQLGQPRMGTGHGRHILLMDLSKLPDAPREQQGVASP